MKNLYKTMLMATAAVFIASGVHAEGTQNTGSMNSQQSYNSGTTGNTGVDADVGVDTGITGRAGADSSRADRRPDNRSMNDRSANGGAEIGANANSNVNAQTNAQQATRLSNSSIRDVQESLNDQGYSVSVDGVWGQETAEAIRSFQSERGNLNATGNLDSDTLAELDVEVEDPSDMR